MSLCQAFGQAPRRKPFAVVLHDEANLAVGGEQADSHPRRVCVLDDVGKQLARVSRNAASVSA